MRRMLCTTLALLLPLVASCEDSLGGLPDLTGTERGTSERSTEAARDDARARGAEVADEQCQASSGLPATDIRYRRAECWQTETFLYVCEVRWRAWCVDRVDEF